MWEKLPELEEKAGGDYSVTSSQRMRVLGGWIVRSVVTQVEGGAGVHHIFIADSDHIWKID